MHDGTYHLNVPLQHNWTPAEHFRVLKELHAFGIVVQSYNFNELKEKADTIEEYWQTVHKQALEMEIIKVDFNGKAKQVWTNQEGK